MRLRSWLREFVFAAEIEGIAEIRVALQDVLIHTTSMRASRQAEQAVIVGIADRQINEIRKSDAAVERSGAVAASLATRLDHLLFLLEPKAQLLHERPKPTMLLSWETAEAANMHEFEEMPHGVQK